MDSSAGSRRRRDGPDGIGTWRRREANGRRLPGRRIRCSFQELPQQPAHRGKIRRRATVRGDQEVAAGGANETEVTVTAEDGATVRDAPDFDDMIAAALEKA